jgi:hypothetical protein
LFFGGGGFEGGGGVGAGLVEVAEGLVEDGEAVVDFPEGDGEVGARAGGFEGGDGGFGLAGAPVELGGLGEEETAVGGTAGDGLLDELAGAAVVSGLRSLVSLRRAEVEGTSQAEVGIVEVGVDCQGLFEGGNRRVAVAGEGGEQVAVLVADD